MVCILYLFVFFKLTIDIYKMNNSTINVSLIKVVKDGSVRYKVEYKKNNAIIHPVIIKNIKPEFVCNGNCNTCDDKECYKI
jgi:hypothetical protein